ncbi:MAG: hypothetical protein ACT4PM_07395 [Gemmatimonadales bacterium]
MVRLLTPSPAALLALAFFPPTALPQAKIALGKPDAEYPEGITRVTAVRELPTGKVLIADALDKVVQLVDLAAGTAVKVGREGSGPGEYELPISLAGLPDGSTLVQDMLNRRFLIVGADGKPGEFLGLPRPPGSEGGPGMAIGGMEVRAADSQGRLYFQGVPFSRGVAADSVPLLRWDRVRPTLDTVGFLKMPAGSVQVSGGRGRGEVRIGGQKAFTPAETWAVTGDGRIARVLPSPYRVVWYDGQGRPTAGPVQPYTPIKVTDADKEQVREARQRNPGIAITVGPEGRSVSRAPVSQMPDLQFEETMPPFPSGAGSGGVGVLGTPDGEVWVLRHRPASDKVPSYDVFDRSGALVKKVTLPPNCRVVGFGKGTVYVVRTDEDDLQYLQRYRKP